MLSIGPQRLNELQDAVQQRQRECAAAAALLERKSDYKHRIRCCDEQGTGHLGLHGFFKDQGLDPEDYPAGTARAEKLFEEAVADPEHRDLRALTPPLDEEVRLDDAWCARAT